MKRISLASISTALDFPSQTKSSAPKSLQNQESHTHSKETARQNLSITERSSLIQFPHCLFGECFPCTSIEANSNKSYHKLHYHSLDKKDNKKQQNIDLERKTLSLKDSFLSFGNQKVICETNGQTTKPANQCFITDMIGSQKLQKYNVLDVGKNTGRSSIMVSTMNSMNGCYSKHQNCVNSKLFLSQDLKIMNTLQHVHFSKDLKPDKDSKNLPDNYQKVLKTRRLSTNDSIKMKENLQAEQSQAISPLQLASILCQSIKINQQDRKSQNLFDFDHMKDSLIDKLNINLLKKQESFIDSKRKSFIRSRKLQKQAQNSPRFYNEEPVSMKQASKSHQNEQDFIEQNKVKSCETVEQKMVRNKFKTLNECGNTIVSRYNKSSQQKSILDESNIVFQASKMCSEIHEQNIKLPTFSDSSIIFKNQAQENNENSKHYNSFIHQLNLDEQSELKIRNSNDNQYKSKKVNRAFLRSKKSSSQKQIKSEETDEMEIRFDLDTFIEYGPL